VSGGGRGRRSKGCAGAPADGKAARPGGRPDTTGGRGDRAASGRAPPGLQPRREAIARQIDLAAGAAGTHPLGARRAPAPPKGHGPSDRPGGRGDRAASVRAPPGAPAPPRGHCLSSRPSAGGRRHGARQGCRPVVWACHPASMTDGLLGGPHEGSREREELRCADLAAPTPLRIVRRFPDGRPQWPAPARRDGRVVEGARLESV
jgi:hypothetical protein